MSVSPPGSLRISIVREWQVDMSVSTHRIIRCPLIQPFNQISNDTSSRAVNELVLFDNSTIPRDAEWRHVVNFLRLLVKAEISPHNNVCSAAIIPIYLSISCIFHNNLYQIFSTVNHYGVTCWRRCNMAIMRTLLFANKFNARQWECLWNKTANVRINVTLGRVRAIIFEVEMQ